MVTSQKSTGRASSIPVGLAWGAAANLIVTVSAAAVIAKLLDMEKLEWDSVGYGILLLLLLSSFTGAEIACNKIKRQKMLVSLMAGGVYFGMLLSITALFFGGQYEGIGVTAALVFAGSVTAGLLGIREKGRRRYGKSAGHHR